MSCVCSFQVCPCGNDHTHHARKTGKECSEQKCSCDLPTVHPSISFTGKPICTEHAKRRDNGEYCNRFILTPKERASTDRNNACHFLHGGIAIISTLYPRPEY